MLRSGAAWAADADDAVAAPSTSDDKTAAPSPAADTPRPISAPPPPPMERSDERTANNAIYVEGLGAGLFYSVNYDRAFGDFAARAGFSYVSVSASAGSSDGTSGSSAHASLITIPLTVSYLGIGSKKHMFEVGAGATLILVGGGGSAFNVDSSSSGSGSAFTAIGDVILGYRLQPPDGGFFFRAGLNTLVGGGIFPVIPWPYVALGGTF